MSIELSVIIPTYNEEDVLDYTVEEVRRMCGEESLRSEVLIVEDASTDETAAIALSLASRHEDVRVLENERNLGKGGSVRRGMLEATGTFRLFMDADGSVSARQIPRFLAALRQGHDVAIGSRRHPDANVPEPQPIHRRISGRLGNALLVRPLLLPGYRDTQVGFKMFRDECAVDVFGDLTTSGWIFDVEILWLCERRGYRIATLPVTWRDRGESAVGAFDFLRSAMGVLRLWRRGRRESVSTGDGEPT